MSGTPDAFGAPGDSGTSPATPAPSAPAVGTASPAATAADAPGERRARRAPASASASVIEDYLKVIYAHTEWQSERITSSQLALRLALAPSTVTEMIKKLVSRGLVEHEPYGAIALTAAGRAEALRMVRRHRLIETWLVRQFGYGWDEVHDEAEVLEHVVSDRLLAAMDDALGHPSADPHGDPIPDRDGRVTVPVGVRGDELAPGSVGRVLRISDRDVQVLRDLDASGIRIGSTVIGGSLAEHLAEHIWLTLD